jgi:hypothetical protein
MATRSDPGSSMMITRSSPNVPPASQAPEGEAPAANETASDTKRTETADRPILRHCVHATRRAFRLRGEHHDERGSKGNTGDRGEKGDAGTDGVTGMVRTVFRRTAARGG